MIHGLHQIQDRLACRRGFTLIELLVAITIVGVLIALLLPAVQAARTSARRMQCAGNLKQLGLALMSYHAQRGSLPPGYVSGVSSTGADTGPGWGWIATSLPFLEQTPLWSSIDFRQPIESSANSARRQLIRGLLCPANELTHSTWPAEVRDAAGNAMSLICRVGFCPYVGMQGSNDDHAIGDGLFFRNSRIRFQDVDDGTSQTIAAGERAYRLGNATWVGAVTGASMFPDSYDGHIAAPHVKPSSGMVLGHVGLGNRPNSTTSEINQFYSLHGDGANFVFADGHVLFLPGTIDYPVYRAMATRAGAEGVGSF